MTTSNTIDIADAPAFVKSESSIASVRRMLKNSLLISIRDSVLLKLATVDLLLVVFCIGLFLCGLYFVPALMGAQPWSPTPSTTAHAPELRTAKRSPAMPATKA